MKTINQEDIQWGYSGAVNACIWRYVTLRYSDNNKILREDGALCHSVGALVTYYLN